MSRVIYPPTSPYAGTPQASWYLGRFVWRDIAPDAGDTLYTLLPRHQNRPDTLSFDLYNTPAFWWVFCVRNPFMRADPIWSCRAGQTIWVPDAGTLRRVAG